MISSPFTEIGRLAQEVSQLENKLNNKAENYEINDIKNHLSRIRNDVQSLENVIGDLQDIVGEIQQKVIHLEEKNG